MALAHVLVLAFAAIVLAVLLDAATQPLRRAGLSRSWSTTIACVAFAAAVAAIGLSTGNQIQAQASELVRHLPTALLTLEGNLGIELVGTDGGGQRLLGYALQDVLRQALSVGEMAAALAASIVVV
jgi:predicted PurR-regulated permease PerM